MAALGFCFLFFWYRTQQKNRLSFLEETRCSRERHRNADSEKFRYMRAEEGTETRKTKPEGEGTETQGEDEQGRTPGGPGLQRRK